MPTTIHMPDQLLAALDKRAKELGISRNRLIVQAVEQALETRSAWPPGFLERFRNVELEMVEAVDEMLENIMRSRRSKPPIRL